MRRNKIGFVLLSVVCLLAVGSCRKKERPVIAVIPKGQAHVFWQAIHAGAVAAGQEFGVDILWNGPANEIDFSRQGNAAEIEGSLDVFRRARPFFRGDFYPLLENTVSNEHWAATQYHRADLARSGCRTSYWPWQRVFNVGFRVVCEAQAPDVARVNPLSARCTRATRLEGERGGWMPSTWQDSPKCQQSW